MREIYVKRDASGTGAGRGDAEENAEKTTENWVYVSSPRWGAEEAEITECWASKVASAVTA